MGPTPMRVGKFSLTRKGIGWFERRPDEGTTKVFRFHSWPRRDFGRPYGHTVAIETRGPDAVEDLNVAISRASDAVARNMMETMKALRVVGVDLDIDSIGVLHVEPTEEDSRYLISWKAIGYQRRNLIQRIIWAVKL